MHRFTHGALLLALLLTWATPAAAQAPPLADQAQTALDNKQWKQAIDLATQLLASDPSYNYANYLRAYGEYQLNQYAAALKDLDLARSLGTKYPNILSLRGDTLFAMERYVDAIAAYTSAVALQTDTGVQAAIYDRRGESEEDLDRHSAAIADYNKSLDLKPANTSTLHDLANAYYAAGNDAACERALYRAIAAAPRDYWSYGHLGVFRWLQRRYADSLAAFTKAISLAPKNYSMYDDRAIVYASSGSLTRALADSDKAIALQSDSGPLDNRAVLYWIAGKTAEALSSFGVAIAKGNNDALANRGVLYFTLGRTELAAADLQRAVASYQKKGFDDGDSTRILAIAYRRLHQNQKAITVLRAARVPADTWPKPAVNFLLGDIPAAAMLAAANTKSERADALTYTALEASVNGGRPSKTDLTWVIAHTSQTDWNQYLARFLLK